MGQYCSADAIRAVSNAANSTKTVSGQSSAAIASTKHGSMLTSAAAHGLRQLHGQRIAELIDRISAEEFQRLLVRYNRFTEVDERSPNLMLSLQMHSD